MKLFKVCLIALFFCVGCSTNNTPTLNQIIYNKASMTTSLKSLNPDFKVQLLKTGVQGSNYVRVSSLKLANIPVIAAISQTDLKNKTFVTLLANADTQPIGKMLFSPNSKFKRNSQMTVINTTVNSISNPVIKNYLKSIGYDDSQAIIERKSQFLYNSETMDLIEYILPSIKQFITGK